MAYYPPELLTTSTACSPDIRAWAGVIEWKPGVFYAHNQPFLDFHLLAGSAPG